MDLTETIAPKSDQLNADDLQTGPRTFTVTEVSKGSPEQPVDIHLAEIPGRAYRPSKTMRRVLVDLWGKDSSAYTGRRLTLYRDPEVTFGRDKVGGIKISHASDIDGPRDVRVTVTRGKKATHHVDILTESPNDERIANLTAEWHKADDDRKVEIVAEVDAIRAKS